MTGSSAAGHGGWCSLASPLAVCLIIQHTWAETHLPYQLLFGQQSVAMALQAPSLPPSLSLASPLSSPSLPHLLHFMPPSLPPKLSVLPSRFLSSPLLLFPLPFPFPCSLISLSPPLFLLLSINLLFYTLLSCFIPSSPFLCFPHISFLLLSLLPSPLFCFRALLRFCLFSLSHVLCLILLSSLLDSLPLTQLLPIQKTEIQQKCGINCFTLVYERLKN